jgi:hypothetical protein
MLLFGSELLVLTDIFAKNPGDTSKVGVVVYSMYQRRGNEGDDGEGRRGKREKRREEERRGEKRREEERREREVTNCCRLLYCQPVHICCTAVSGISSLAVLLHMFL